ncbi:1-acyl-sn-glycerol-3-phosphate acyltransferase [Oculatella sp. FACHB-28]|uniref:1-acyl-sn-glycerol-3-phosphate acyltransferase n=1 Tax=Oculatella sp. FACHB-28 TaxID=2692845 RepID=UPI001F54AED9|nr:1-acyl-sn-glycerol-3-phosphate acyltransferase [Oculatella sp. FACHB-28]
MRGKQAIAPKTVTSEAKTLKAQKPSPSSYRFGWFDWFCLWYPPGWLILFNRHWQHYHADPEGWNWLEYILFLLPGGFYLALLLRWLRLGGRSPRQTDASVEPGYQKAFRDEILAPILQHHFQPELHNTEHLPQQGHFIVVLNHAGMAFPWDFVGLGTLLSQTKGWFVQPVAHEIFFDHPWLKWWLPAGWSQILGGIRANRDSFEMAVADEQAETVLLYAPESWRGLAKGWQQRHQLETFDPSFIKLSDRHHIPILPVLCIGNEFLHPWAFNSRKLTKWTGLPLFPLSPLMIAFLLFPSMGVWAAKTHLRYYIQPLEKPWQRQHSLQNRSVAYQEAQDLRSRLQNSMNDYLSQLVK